MSMLETLAGKAPALVFYAIAMVTGFVGMLTLWFPVLGFPVLGISFFAFQLARIARRLAREHEVRRQLGG